MLYNRRFFPVCYGAKGATSLIQFLAVLCTCRIWLQFSPALRLVTFEYLVSELCLVIVEFYVPGPSWLFLLYVILPSSDKIIFGLFLNLFF